MDNKEEAEGDEEDLDKEDMNNDNAETETDNAETQEDKMMLMLLSLSPLMLIWTQNLSKMLGMIWTLRIQNT